MKIVYENKKDDFDFTKLVIIYPEISLKRIDPYTMFEVKRTGIKLLTQSTCEIEEDKSWQFTFAILGFGVRIIRSYGY